MNPPIVYAVTIPSSHITISIRKTVHSIAVYLQSCCAYLLATADCETYFCTAVTNGPTVTSSPALGFLAMIFAALKDFPYTFSLAESSIETIDPSREIPANNPFERE